MTRMGPSFGKSGASKVAGLVKVVVDPRHHIDRISSVEAIGGEYIFEYLGEARSHDGPGAHAVDQNAISGKTFR